MAKDKLPNPIHFPARLYQNNLVAINRFNDLVKKGCYGDIWLVSTTHWASEGTWILFKRPELTIMDKMLKHNHNANPKPWTPPPSTQKYNPDKYTELDEDEGEE